MSRNTSRLFGEKSVSPSSFYLSKCILTSSDGQEIDIRELVTNITITESLYMGSIDADLIILDGVNLLESFKINGDEKIKIEIKRKPIDNPVNEVHKHEFYISEILNYSRSNPGSASYIFRCVSLHAYVNNSVTIKGYKSGTIGKIVKDICKDLGVTKSDINEATDKVINCIIPRLRPLAAIKWLNSNAFTTTGAPFYFYETLKNKVKYKSFEDFIDEDIIAEFEHRPTLQKTIGEEEYFTESAKRIRKVSSEFNLSKYISTGEGAFASTTHSIDISTKTYKEPKEFAYSNKIKKINKNKPYPDRADNTQYGGRKIDEIKTGKNYFISENDLAFGNANNFHSPVRDHISTSQSYLSTEDTLTHDITINGNFNLEVGNIIKVRVEKTNISDHKSDPVDKMQSGNYLITSIIHDFGDEYTQQLEIKTNSFNPSLEDILQIEKNTA